MHQKSLDLHGEWMDSGEQDNSIIQGVITCACGCGTVMHKNKWGRQQVFVNGHQVKKRSMEEWNKKYQEVLASLPLCLCGCGEKTRLSNGSSLEEFIKSQGARRFYKRLYGHDKRPEQWKMEITNNERQAILGTLLGDCSILYPNNRSLNPRLQCNHGEPQAEWVEHKRNYLERLGGHLSRKANGGYGKFTISYISQCLPCLADLYDFCIKDGKKTITLDWLNQIGEIGLAWWICDDGSSCGRGLLLHTEGYSIEENEIICDWFAKNYGKATINRSSRGYHWIYLSAEVQRNILPIVSPYIPEFMQYKLASSLLCSASSRKTKGL